MEVKISRETESYWQKKGALAIRFVTEGREGVIVNQVGRQSLVLVVKEPEKVNRRKLILLARRVMREALAKKFDQVVIDFSKWKFPAVVTSDQDLGELLTVNFLMAQYAFRDFLTAPKEGWPAVKAVIFVNASGKEVREGVSRGMIIGEEVNHARDISNMPGGEMTPELLALHAKRAVRGLPVKVTILEEEALKRLKMGGIIGVGKGSEAKPRFIILEYFGVDTKEKPIVLVGKGVTFDTGGISLKPYPHTTDMNMDMSGGAAVIHSVVIAARLKLARNVVALIPAVENMPSGSSYRPGDVLRTMSGKTIEVLNTDAEGRIILADALHYAKRYKPELVIDVATLTGSAAVALGERASAIFTRKEALELKIRHLGEESGDYVWPMPLWDEYDEDIKGTYGDVANVGKSRFGDVVHAATFLKQFVGQAYPWIHIDMAPRMTATGDEFLAKGAAGAPVRLLVKVLEKFESH